MKLIRAQPCTVAIFQAVTQRMKSERNLAAQMTHLVTHLVTSYSLRLQHAVAEWQAPGKMLFFLIKLI